MYVSLSRMEEKSPSEKLLLRRPPSDSDIFTKRTLLPFVLAGAPLSYFLFAQLASWAAAALGSASRELYLARDGTRGLLPGVCCSVLSPSCASRSPSLTAVLQRKPPGSRAGILFCDRDIQTRSGLRAGCGAGPPPGRRSSLGPGSTVKISRSCPQAALRLHF